MELWARGQSELAYCGKRRAVLAGDSFPVIWKPPFARRGHMLAKFHVQSGDLFESANCWTLRSFATKGP